ncbi:hypothetical protein ACTA71_001091 [Dictyostelium dimigraforme]
MNEFRVFYRFLQISFSSESEIQIEFMQYYQFTKKSKIKRKSNPKSQIEIDRSDHILEAQQTLLNDTSKENEELNFIIQISSTRFAVPLNDGDNESSINIKIKSSQPIGTIAVLMASKELIANIDENETGGALEEFRHIIGTQEVLVVADNGVVSFL